MNQEFHYYAILYLAKAAGVDLEIADIIAMSSARVDRALVAHEILDGPLPRLTEVTQDYQFWSEETLRDIYLPFHFIPGDRARTAVERLDGDAAGLCAYVVTPDSPLAKELLVRALRSDDPWRIGIALHAYADTWAHQHFSGRMERVNEIDPSSPLPPAGHLQALRVPDDPGGIWVDRRLLPELITVHNADRFLAAARMVFRYFRTWRHEAFTDEGTVLEGLAHIWADPAMDSEGRIASYVVDLDVEPLEPRRWLEEAGIEQPGDDEGRLAGYDRLLWLKSGLASRGVGKTLHAIQTGGRYEASSLRRWDKAARAHRREAQSLFAEAGL